MTTNMCRIKRMSKDTMPKYETKHRVIHECVHVKRISKPKVTRRMVYYRSIFLKKIFCVYYELCSSLFVKKYQLVPNFFYVIFRKKPLLRKPNIEDRYEEQERIQQPLY